jgi:hypothetical protein
MNRNLKEWWERRSAVEKAALAVTVSAASVGLGCAVAFHGIVVVTPKLVVAAGPVAQTIAKAALATAAA